MDTCRKMEAEGKRKHSHREMKIKGGIEESFGEDKPLVT